MLLLILTILSIPSSASWLVQKNATPTQIPVEVAQVLDLPVTISSATLVKTKDGYHLKVALANSSDSNFTELRYSISIVNAMSEIKPLVTASNSLKLPPAQADEITFLKTLKPKLNQGDRLVMIVEQIVANDYLWNVVNTQEFLSAYVRSDYSIAPRVVRTTNFIDAPMKTRVIY